uniref:Ig-like domain-containing protein n=1 Tax=Pundamilia nyererei TaxID=303518 RepID=A0A3B4FV57_9CICH
CLNICPHSQNLRCAPIARHAQITSHAHVGLGQTVNINCKVSTQVAQYSGSQYYLAWYHQKTGEAPKALIYLTSDRLSGISSRLSGSGAGNGLDFTLSISAVQADDAGVYYCQSYHSTPMFTQ